MTREEAKQKFDNFGKSFTLEEARLDTHILIDQIYDAHEAELKAKDEEIKNLKAMLQNMCAECECAKFADNAIKPSEMWKLHLALKDNK